MSSAISFNQVTKVFPAKTTALDSVDLEVKEGEFMVVVGPSGCGKTTLLNILGGLDHPTEGRVEVGGTEISWMKDSALIDFRLQNIGFVFQAYNLLPTLTVLENIALPLELNATQWPEAVSRVQRCRQTMAQLGIGHLHDPSFDTLQFISGTWYFQQEEKVHHAVHCHFALTYPHCFHQDDIEPGRFTKGDALSGFTGNSSKGVSGRGRPDKGLRCPAEVLHPRLVPQDTSFTQRTARVYRQHGNPFPF